MTTNNFVGMTNNLTTNYIGFNQNDFLYYQYHSADLQSFCENSYTNNTQGKCATNILNNVGGYETTTQNYTNCYKGELCRNKEYADQINSIITTQIDSTERLFDTESKFNMEVIKTVNYTMGIGFIVLTLFFC